jgi:hypothetical protein
MAHKLMEDEYTAIPLAYERNKTKEDAKLMHLCLDPRLHLNEVHTREWVCLVEQ